MAILAQVMAEARRGRAAKRQVEQRRDLIHALDGLFHFRAIGCRNGMPLDPSEDIEKTVKPIEAKNVVDPLRIQQAFSALPTALAGVDGDYSRLDPKVFDFNQQGQHAFLTTTEQLLDVHGRGFILLAEFGPNHLPVAYCYGLDETPFKGSPPNLDPDYPTLDAGDINHPLRAFIVRNRTNILAIWRTTVEQSIVDPETFRKLGIGVDEKGFSLRRMGIGTIMKFLAMYRGLCLKKIGVTLNVGTLVSTEQDTLHMPNDASAPYNENFLKDAGWRSKTTSIRMLRPRVDVAEMYWHAYRNTIDEGLRKTREILLKMGWTNDFLLQLEKTAAEIAEKTLQERAPKTTA